MTRHFLNLTDAGREAIVAILADALRRQAMRRNWPRAKGKPDVGAPLTGYVLAMLFEKPSTRTRISFDIAMRQLGGSSFFMGEAQMQLGRGETIADTARILSEYVDLIMMRTDHHSKIEEMAAHASVPVINGLTDLSHPCQMVADLLTLFEKHKLLGAIKVAWLGDVNNVLSSLIEAAGLFRFGLKIGCPQGYVPNPAFIEPARARGAKIDIVHTAQEAVVAADVVVTDTWLSMGQLPNEQKMTAMKPFQVNAVLMQKAKPQALFLHCMPAHRGQEVTDDVLDGPQSRVWETAANRVYAQKSILLWCLDKL